VGSAFERHHRLTKKFVLTGRPGPKVFARIFNQPVIYPEACAFRPSPRFGCCRHCLNPAIIAGEPIVHMLVPGFTVRELPLRLPNINNLRFAPDGRLTALGYDGRIWLLP